MKGLEDRDNLSNGLPDGLSETIESPQAPEQTQTGSKVLVLPVNGESRKITQVLSNETSLRILELLGEKSMSATNIAEELNLPLTTVKYNLDSLIESGLIKVKQIKWSQKGRQVKIYESMEKLIVLVPSKSTIDKLSIISILQKYIGVIGAACFAAAGIEYFSVYMQAKRIFDATAPLRTETPSTANNSSTQAYILKTNESDNVSRKLALDQQTPENGTIETMSTNSGALVTETGNSSSGSETVSGQGSIEVHAATSNATGSLHNLSSVPPESIAHTGGIHGFYDALSLHPGVWFLFGCIFIVSLMIVREIYYKKKVK